MRTLNEALQIIEDGWNASTVVIERAVAMREALRSGDDLKADMLADEIDTLQEAEVARQRAEWTRATGFSPEMPESGNGPKNEKWVIDLKTWAEVLIGGGYRRERFFNVMHGATVDQARDRACEVFASVNWCEPTPVAEMKRTFAMAAQ